MDVRLDVLSIDLRPLIDSFSGTPAAEPLVLASGLARNGAPPGTSAACLVLRSSPAPALAVATTKSEPGFDGWLAATRRFLDALPEQVRVLTYDDVEVLVDRLADRLVDALGKDLLDGAAFVGVPRSGFIVLGMLAYALGLRPDQLMQTVPGSGPVVVVDDCAYSGARIGEVVGEVSGDQDIVVALLLAPPPLLDALCEQENRIVAAVAADYTRDLTAVTTRPQWTTEWSALLQDRPRYWIGVTDYVVFPWGETDWSYWNDLSQQVEDGWSIMPPEVHLERHASTGNEALPVQVQPTGPGPLQPADEVLFATIDDIVVVNHTGTGRRFLLEGVAADMWVSLVTDGDPDAVVTTLLARYDIEEPTLRSDLAEFVAEATEAGILQAHALHDD